MCHDEDMKNRQKLTEYATTYFGRPVTSDEIAAMLFTEVSDLVDAYGHDVLGLRGDACDEYAETRAMEMIR